MTTCCYKSDGQDHLVRFVVGYWIVSFFSETDDYYFLQIVARYVGFRLPASSKKQLPLSGR